LTFRIEPLGPDHDRGAFCCGNPTIDSFCTEQALKDHDKGKVRVFVACPDDTNRVVGFYSLVVATLEPRVFPGFGKRRIPALYLAMVGVHEEWRAGVKGTGTALMVHAFQRTLEIADRAGLYCLFLDAVDDKTAGFYAGIQFERITEGKLAMYIAIPTIRDALSD
jgi:hypothetical protein